MKTPELDLNWTMPTYAALMERAQAKSEMLPDARSSRRDSAANGQKWYGGATWDQALSMAINGDVKGATTLRPQIIAGATQMRMSLGRLDPVYRLDEGRWIDVARYVKGEPECWGDMVEVQERTVRRAVSVVINTCVASSVSAEDMNRVAVAVGSAVLGLQSSGYTVSVYLAVVNAGHGHRSQWLVCAPINQGGAPLDISRLSAVLRPWFFRRIIFSVWETAGNSQRYAFNVTANGGYGYPGRLADTDAVKITGDANAVMIDVEQYIHNETAIKDKILGAMSDTGDKCKR